MSEQTTGSSNLHEKLERLRSIHYFWQDKGDPSRFVSYDPAEFPEVETAYQDYLKATRMYSTELDRVLEQTEDDIILQIGQQQNDRLQNN